MLTAKADKKTELLTILFFDFGCIFFMSGLSFLKMQYFILPDCCMFYFGIEVLLC